MGEVKDFCRDASLTGDAAKFILDELIPEGLTAVGMRRAALGIVPGRVGSVAEFPMRFPPGPHLNQGVKPQDRSAITEGFRACLA